MGWFIKVSAREPGGWCEKYLNLAFAAQVERSDVERADGRATAGLVMRVVLPACRQQAGLAFETVEVHGFEASRLLDKVRKLARPGLAPPPEVPPAGVPIHPPSDTELARLLDNVNDYATEDP